MGVDGGLIVLVLLVKRGFSRINSVLMGNGGRRGVFCLERVGRVF